MNKSGKTALIVLIVLAVAIAAALGVRAIRRKQLENQILSAWSEIERQQQIRKNPDYYMG